MSGIGGHAVTVDTLSGAFTASAPATVAGGPQIFWTAAPDATQVTYRIQRGGPGGNVQFDGVSNGWTDPSNPLALGTVAHHTVQAVDFIGCM